MKETNVQKATNCDSVTQQATDKAETIFYTITKSKTTICYEGKKLTPVNSFVRVRQTKIPKLIKFHDVNKL